MRFRLTTLLGLSLLILAAASCTLPSLENGDPSYYHVPSIQPRAGSETYSDVPAPPESCDGWSDVRIEGTGLVQEEDPPAPVVQDTTVAPVPAEDREVRDVYAYSTALGELDDPLFLHALRPWKSRRRPAMKGRHSHRRERQKSAHRPSTPGKAEEPGAARGQRPGGRGGASPSRPGQGHSGRVQ